jgi:chaperone required for assembly of F1-ATPase
MSAKKRFYKDVQVNVADGGFAVELDGRGVRSPAGTQAIVPVRGLADAMNGTPRLRPLTPPACRCSAYR